MQGNTTPKEIAQALYTINRHAKTAPQPQHLYQIKKKAIEQLVKEKKAKRIGLHFSEHPKLSNQHSTLLIKVDDYYFHTLPTKKDFQELKHLGSIDQNYRNPQTKMSLSYAKKIIYRYIGWEQKKKNTTHQSNKQKAPNYYIPSALGKMEWPPTKSHGNRKRTTHNKQTNK